MATRHSKPTPLGEAAVASTPAVASTRLYLDTARMGLMSPRAQKAQQAFTHLAGKEGCSLWFSRFVRHGFGKCTLALKHRYGGLADWQGLHELKASLLRLLGLSLDSEVLLAGRLTQLMKLAARLLFARCRRVLLTDLTWPNYRTLLGQEQQQTARKATCLAIHSRLLYQQLSLVKLVHAIAQQYEQDKCDGLFLPAITHDGIRLPIRTIYRAVCQIRRPRLFVVDGAQDFCHAPTNLHHPYCDLYLAGAHKWLGARLPLGIAVAPCPDIYEELDHHLQQMTNRGQLDDPLLHLTRQLEGRGTNALSETVNLTPLFSCRAAVADIERSTHQQEKIFPIAEHFSRRLQNARLLIEHIAGGPWQPLLPAAPLRSAIVLLRCKRSNGPVTSAQKLRNFFQQAGLSLTVYDGQVLRLSMPHTPWHPHALQLVRDQLHGAAELNLPTRPRLPLPADCLTFLSSSFKAQSLHQLLKPSLIGQLSSLLGHTNPPLGLATEIPLDL